MSDAEKKCTRCNKVKPATEFSIRNHRTGRRLSWCKSCAAAWMNEYRRTTPAGDDARAYDAARKRVLNQLAARHRDEYLALLATELGRPLRQGGRKAKKAGSS